ncbi:MAG: beta-ketoacyl-ACP synthase III [Crocinitomicaceae bacterium]|nr:beta-ketoacyl-ACP synthase III [Crocinitomicaceae bacterium]
MSEVYITRTASFLPNEAVSNDEMENYLGCIGEQASKSRRIVLRNNGIENRYYAIDKNGNATHSNAEMVSLAVRNLMDNKPENLKQIDLLSCGTSTPDQMMPSHAVMVHGWLPETNNIEVVSPSGVCCSGMHAYKYAYMALKLGEAKTAVCSGSERLSRILHSEQFELEVKRMGELEENPYLAFEKDFLRWMLSDGAATFLMSTKKSETGISLKVDWIEAYSFANEAETCMYMASDKNEDGTLKSYMDYSPQEINDKSILSIKQDVKLLGENIVRLGFKKLEGAIKNKGINVDDITYFLPHMSSYFFEDKIADMLVECDMHIPKERWFTNLKTKGNVGAGSIYLMVDELFNSGKLKKGDKVLLAVPESSRFSYVFSMLTVC